ncbi:MAG: LytTR family transcriptional regulator DNA-binding domain-containing protein [Lachnospiraceae bacterium]|nr:LytTR family transcriptional regulator DNA-binding domain-containing protein [Lachnospiraceae bacterium]
MLLHVLFSFEENDNPPLADISNVFVKVNASPDIPSNAYHAFLKTILKLNRKYVPIYLLIRTGKDYESVNIEDILFIEVFHHTLVIHCENKTYETQGSLTQMEECLRDCGFIRINRHYLVSFDKIMRISHNEIILKKEKQLHVGRTYQKMLRALIRQKSF